MWLLHTLFEFSEVKLSVTLYMGDRMQTWWLMGYPPTFNVRYADSVEKMDEK